MVEANFEHDGNRGTLGVTTHFDEFYEIACIKQDDETFRLGGTAINEVMTYEGVLLMVTPFCESRTRGKHSFRALTGPTQYFEEIGDLSCETWNSTDLHCYVTEYYPLDVEGNKHGWFISKSPIKDSQYIFINLDVIDGGGNVVKRYRVSPFTGEHKILEY